MCVDLKDKEKPQLKARNSFENDDFPKNILPKDGEVLFYPNFFSNEESNYFFESLLNKVSWRQEAIFLFGKEIMQPRLTAWYGDYGKSYSYSGITMQPDIWIHPLIIIKERIEKIAGIQFTSALLNQYRDQNDSVGWHRDNETELGKNPVIGSVSFGATRKFVFQHCLEKDLKASVELCNGSFLLMRGQTQHFWRHSIPKLRAQVEARINITFRVII